MAPPEPSVGVLGRFGNALLSGGFAWGVAGLAAVVALVMVPKPPINFSPHCRDGWRSPSIGMQGACSWHGGVASLELVPGWLMVPLAAGTLAAIGAVVLQLPFALRREKRRQARRETAVIASGKAIGPPCPVCGSPSVLFQAAPLHSAQSLFAQRKEATTTTFACVGFPERCVGLIELEGETAASSEIQRTPAA
jgi:hypothetical protein